MDKSKWDYSIFWKETLNQLRSELSEQEFLMWFDNISYTESTEKKIILSVPSSFYRDQVKERYLSNVENILQNLSGSKIDIDFSIVSSPSPAKKNNPNKKTSTPVNVKVNKPLSATISKRNHPGLSKDYSFDNFIVGDNSSFAANACMAIAKNPGKAYNPCLIYGGVGLGKTHLIQSIGKYSYENSEDLRVVYVTAEQFTNEFIQAIKNSKQHDFKNKYRKVDILLIDDIHFLQSKDATQEELFHTFNALYDSNKQMVFTCDRPVSEIKNLTDRLRSRFERGLNVDLIPPSFETRIAILKKKIEDKNVSISDEVIELICQNVTTHVRDLEAALTKLIAYADLLNKEITVSIAKSQLKDMFANPKLSNITIDTIQRIVSDYFNLTPNDLRGKKRTKAIAFPRQIAMYITRELTEYSTTEVGLEFGGRDHTTVMHACQRVDSKMKADPSIEPYIRNLIQKIKETGTKS
ncbi:MAG: chromosomal replication initiator protein DnaA [Spirochaetales bacterium]|nr:chromosomal replication initiator protein DnaA [Spirochaetales bacterium]